MTIPGVGCTDWFGGLGKLALTIGIKTDVTLAPEIFLSPIFLSKIVLRNRGIETEKFLGPISIAILDAYFLEV